jgi:hypothetical protein
VLTSLDGLTGGPGDAGADGGSTFDANGSGYGDGGAPGTDATVDGVDASDGAAPPFCASQSPAPTFCADFDEDPLDGAVLGDWDQVTGLGGAVTRAGGLFTSAPYAMLATANAPIEAGIDLCGYKAFPAAAKTGEYVLAFDLYVATADTTKRSDAVLAAFELLGTFGTRWALQLEVFYDRDAGGALDVDFSENLSPATDAGSYVSHPVGTTLPVGAWTRVTMTTTVSGAGSGTIALHFGATEVAKYTNVAIPVLSGSPEILVGLTYAETSSDGWAVRYDDVTFVAP